MTTAKDHEFGHLLSLNHTQLTMGIFALQRVLADARANTIPFHCIGICGNWRIQLEQLPQEQRLNPYWTVAAIAARWSKTTQPGIASWYPVPEQGYIKWQGHNLALRIDLMRYMIKRMHDLKRRRAKAEARKFRYGTSMIQDCQADLRATTRLKPE